MTDQERQQFYDDRQQYKWQCEEFQIELTKFFENYGKPRNTHHLHQLRTGIRCTPALARVPKLRT